MNGGLGKIKKTHTKHKPPQRIYLKSVCVAITLEYWSVIIVYNLCLYQSLYRNSCILLSILISESFHSSGIYQVDK